MSWRRGKEKKKERQLSEREALSIYVDSKTIARYYNK